MPQQQQNPWHDLPPEMQRILRTRPPRSSEVREMVGPRQQGESVIAYGRRVGQLKNELERRWWETNRSTQAPGETNWAFGRRQIGQTAGQALQDVFQGRAQPPAFAQQLQQGFENLWQLPGRVIADAVGGIQYANDTPAAQARRTQSRAQARRPLAVAGQAALAASNPSQQGSGPLPATQQTVPFSGGNPSRIMNFQARAVGFDYVPQNVQTLGQASNFARQVNRAGAPSSAMGLFQITGETMRDFAPRVFGQNWQQAPYNDQNQYRLGEAIFNASRGSAQALRGRWGSLSLQDAERIRQMPWAQASVEIAARESGAGVAGGSGGSVPAPPFQTQHFDQARAANEQAAALLSQPFSTTNAEAPRPELPAPTPFQAPDFTAGNEAFERARPRNPFEEEGSESRLRRRGVMRGMAEALMSMNWGAGPGVGELFARVGAGMLGGRVHADDEIDRRMRVFDEQMRQYELASAGRNDQQAQVINQVANQNIAEMNQHNTRIFSDRLQEWARNLPQVSNGMVVTRTPGEDGQVTTTFTPIGNAIQADMLQRNAQISLAQGGAQMQYDMNVWNAGREDARALLAQTLANPQASPAQRDQAATLEIASMVGSVVDSGQWQQLMPSPESAQQLLGQAYAAAGYDPRMQAGQPPNQEQAQVIRNYISTQLLQTTLQGGAEGIARLYNNPVAQSAYLIGLSGDRRTSTRTDPRGRVSTTTTQGY